MELRDFFGEGPIVFVGSRPSTGSGVFPSEPVKMFYKLLKELGFENAHLTDLVKCRGKAGKAKIEEVQNCLPILQKEISLINNPRIIPMKKEVGGEKMIDILEDGFPNSEIGPRIPHYTWAHQYGSREELRKKLEKLQT